MDNIDSSEEKRQFEAVWKRVTERSNATIYDYMKKGPAAAEHNTIPDNGIKFDPNTIAENSSDINLSQSGRPSPTDRDGSDAGLLKELIDGETGIICGYRVLIRGIYAKKICSLYVRSKDDLKKLKTAYYILSGDASASDAQPRIPEKETLLKSLRSLYWLETGSAEAFYNTSKEVSSDKLSVLLVKISAEKKIRADELESLIGNILSQHTR